MQFKFESNQQFQLQAIDSIAKLFDGQHFVTGEFNLDGEGLAAVPNCLEVGDDAILQNLQQVQTDNGLSVDEKLEYIEADIPLFGEQTSVQFPNFSVEMETGTGKTYVYLRTILELYRRYALRKFIVVVPSVAVREGVIKTLEITQSHLRQLYDNPPYQYHSYDSSKLSQVRQFSLSDGVEISVMTIDSFNKASNVIYQTTDWLQGEIPIHLIQATRPILILDEPQNMVSELRVKALAALNPLFTLRYSATHRIAYNLVYRLTPAEAYQQGIVKRIEVDGVLQEDDVNQPFVRVNNIQSRKNSISARLSVHKLMRDNSVKEQTLTVKFGDDLAQKTNRPEYRGYIVDEIDLFSGLVRFTNGIEVEKGESRGEDKEAIFETQIRRTIEAHFRKQERFKSSGIKVLSLFFIDRVDSYAQETGVIRRLFKECYNELKQEYAPWKDIDVGSVQASYFAQQRTRSGEIIYEDSKTGESQKDAEAYDLIMRDKERLLSFDEPVCFIFSHSALREGWDSPNVFQICTLNQTTSEIKKRQEIGRGVRLTVDQTGSRVYDEGVNVLTVVAVVDLSECYPLPNLIDAMMHQLENTTPPIRLTRQTLLDIFTRTQKQQAALDNPREFASVAVRIIKEKLTDQLIDGIKYEKIGEFYEMCQFETSIETWNDYLIPAKRSIYDKVIFDSETERKFVEGWRNLTLLNFT